MTGDQNDMQGRLWAALPSGWFPTVSPVLTALLAAPAWMLSWLYGLLAYVLLQQRIATATDVNLDMIAQDYLGTRVMRVSGQSDTAFRARVQLEILRKKNTRAALFAYMAALGCTVTIFEPANTGDTGGYASAGTTTWSGLAYGAAGGYGSSLLPFQAFITVTPPVNNGVANVAGYGTGAGGYGVGAIEYASAAGAANQLTNAQIYAAVASCMPAGTTAWTSIV